ncbi:T6SS phospholipase effector Tle1-like catalytic domain-containing protein [Rhizobium paknamense]|uniref:Uncharacterized protein (DUF2235 family) n=1 Tax=Rhizobium paknamense TaxID=1206817 RepID=A0ABU0IAM8_9HYPH|nr:DUF2235 domain-containing protein [Rhizobium paknamense]MDQ0454550.1 uncharacterized protein (DUF2235 family) [Rhizobium paknamense]
MGRNIVILFDGTSNEISADRTNIVRLLGCLKRGEQQLVYYEPGVGTFGADDNWFRGIRKLTETWGLATGWGLDHNVKQAYRFLVENYRAAPRNDKGEKMGEDDRIYILGFSRGAYTARVLAGFIHSLGIIAPNFINLVEFAYRTYKTIPPEQRDGRTAETEGRAPSAFAAMRLYERTLRGVRPAITFLGVFDTVSTVINQTSRGLTFQTFPFTTTNPSIAAVRHACALDERRTMFRPVYWKPDQDFWGGPFRPKDPDKIRKQDFKEVWFAGDHCDVGGGYPEAESAAAKIPLSWMIEESRQFGLLFHEKSVQDLVYACNPAHGRVKPSPLGRLHNSMTLAWKVLEILPRRIPWSSWRRRKDPHGWYIPLCDPRLVRDPARIHQSVLDRMKLSPAAAPYHPINMPESYQIEPWTGPVVAEMLQNEAETA